MGARKHKKVGFLGIKFVRETLSNRIKVLTKNGKCYIYISLFSEAGMRKATFA